MSQISDPSPEVTRTRLPVIALVGRPNVGKSTLFNALTRTRDALVADTPGLTRDRQYGFAEFEGRRYIVVDTAGLDEGKDPLNLLMQHQTGLALQEADAVLFLTDARMGLATGDHKAATEVRKSGKPTLLAVNKAEGLDPAIALTEFYSLGLGEPRALSAAHGDGLRDLMRDVLALCPETADESATNETEDEENVIRVAIIGRPNVGKSTLVNRLLGEDRVLALDMPGTTRDSIRVPFERDGQRYVLIDTAGVRRRARIEENIEKFSVIKTLQAMDSAHVVIMVVDAQDEIGVQDARLLGLAAESGRALVIAVNKWDGIDSYTRKQVQTRIDLKLPFLDYAKPHFISAKHGSGVGELMGLVNQAYRAAMTEIPTPQLNTVLQQALEAHQPAATLGRRVKLRYAHMGGHNPPLIVIHGNQTQKLGEDYKRYLINRFRKAFDLWGTPIKLVFKTGDNPYANRARN